MSLPTSFTQVEGWREDFAAAWRAQDTVRTESLFPQLPIEVAGEPVRPLTLRLWCVLDAAANPFVKGGELTLPAAASLLWVLRPQGPMERLCPAWLFRVRRRCLVWRVVIRNRMGVDTVGEVAQLVNNCFLDSPSGDGEGEGKPAGINPVHMPRRHFAIQMIADVIAEFPALTPDVLFDMPLAQFWQWLHDAVSRVSARNGKDYRNDQPTDRANRRAVRTLNRMRKEARAAEKAHA